jgi:hypothetical protein
MMVLQLTLVNDHILGFTATLSRKWYVFVHIQLDPFKMAAGFSILSIILGFSIKLHIRNLMILSNIKVLGQMECSERGKLNFWLLKKI